MIAKSVSLKDLPKALRQEAGRVRGAGLRGLRMGARRGEALMAVKSQDISDLSLFMQGWTVRNTPKGAELLNDAPHAAIVEAGSRPHWPPLLPILEYLGRKKGVSTAGVTQGGKWDLSDQEMFTRSEALEELRLFAVKVAGKIAAHGTSPKWILRDSQPQFARFVSEEVERALRDAEREARA